MTSKAFKDIRYRDILSFYILTCKSQNNVYIFFECQLIVGKRGKGAYVGDESILFKSYSPDNQKRIRERLTLDDNKWADPMAGTLPSGYQFHADRDYLLPIPPSELELNKKLKQNPKW